MAIPPESPNSCTCCVDQTGLGTRCLAVALALAIHFTIGSLFNYAEDSCERFNYPNLGSSLFVLASSLYCTSRSLLPRALSIKSPLLQSIYKTLVVMLLTNILLVAIWQQIVNLTIELSLLVRDFFDHVNIPSTSWLKYLPCYLSHVIGAVVLAWVVTSLSAREEKVVPGKKQKRRKLNELVQRTEETYDVSYDRSEDWESSQAKEEIDI